MWDFSISPENQNLNTFNDTNDSENLIKVSTCFKSTSAATTGVIWRAEKGVFWDLQHKKQEYQTVMESFTTLSIPLLLKENLSLLKVDTLKILRDLHEKRYVRKLWSDPISAINIIKISWMRTGQIIKTTPQMH